MSALVNSPHVCVLIPTYNHGRFLAPVLTRARCLGWPLIVVDDGSTDETPQVLSAFPEVTVLRLPQNQGKGRALSRGLARASELGFDLAVTLDADGQHDPADAPKLVAAAAGRLDTVVIGSREDGQAGAPLRSRFGRAFSNFWIWIEAGVVVRDAQSGFRLYPVAPFKVLTIRSRRYGWETEVLVRLLWGGLTVREVPISISYAAKPASHFRPLRDFFLNSCVNAYLVCRRLWPWPFMRLVPVVPMAWPPTWRARVRLVWDQYLWGGSHAPGHVALAIGFGVFMGIVPIWGFQMLAAGFLAQRLHLNVLLVLLAANISLPPMIPVIVYVSLLLGHWLSTGQWAWDVIRFGTFTPEMITSRVGEYLVGSSVLAVLAGVGAGLASYGLLSLRKSRVE